jgi:hypothetical protein
MWIRYTEVTKTEMKSTKVSLVLTLKISYMVSEINMQSDKYDLPLLIQRTIKNSMLELF